MRKLSIYYNTIYIYILVIMWGENAVPYVTKNFERLLLPCILLSAHILIIIFLETIINAW